METESSSLLSEELLEVEENLWTNGLETMTTFNKLGKY